MFQDLQMMRNRLGLSSAGASSFTSTSSPTYFEGNANINLGRTLVKLWQQQLCPHSQNITWTNKKPRQYLYFGLVKLHSGFVCTIVYRMF